MDEKVRLFKTDEISCIATSEGFIGEGSYGVVRLGFHDVYGTVAVKCSAMKGGRAERKLIEKMMKREIGHLQKASHENVVRVYGWAQWPGSIAIVMEYLPIGGLKHVLLDRDIDLSWYLRLRFCAEIANGIAFLHNISGNKRLVHGDIKPDNILLCNDLHCKITDFGGAALRSYTGSVSTVSTISTASNESNTKPDSNQYTELYAPPEFLEDPYIMITTKHDAYSLAITMHMILTREPPFSSAPLIQLCLEGVKKCGKRPSVESLNAEKQYLEEIDENQLDILEHLEEEMINCWHQDPKERPSMSEVKDRLWKRLKECDLVTIQQHVVDALKGMDVENPSPENYQCVSLGEFRPPCFEDVAGDNFGFRHEKFEPATLLSQLSEEEIEESVSEDSTLTSLSPDAYSSSAHVYDAPPNDSETSSSKVKDSCSTRVENIKPERPVPVPRRGVESSYSKPGKTNPRVRKPIPSPRRSLRGANTSSDSATSETDRQPVIPPVGPPESSVTQQSSPPESEQPSVGIYSEIYPYEEPLFQPAESAFPFRELASTNPDARPQQPISILKKPSNVNRFARANPGSTPNEEEPYDWKKHLNRSTRDRSKEGYYLTTLPLRRSASTEILEQKDTAFESFFKFFGFGTKKENSKEEPTNLSRQRNLTSKNDKWEESHSEDGVFKPQLPPNHPAERIPRKIESIKCRLAYLRTSKIAIREIEELVDVDPSSVTGDCEMIIDDLNDIIISGDLMEDDSLFHLMNWCMEVCDNITDRNRVLHKLQKCINGIHRVATFMSKRGHIEGLKKILPVQQSAVERIKLVTTIDHQFKTDVHCWALLYVACCYKFLNNKQEAIKICKKAINKMMKEFGKEFRLRSVVATCYRLMAQLTDNATKKRKVYEEIVDLYQTVEKMKNKSIQLEGVYDGDDGAAYIY